MMKVRNAQREARIGDELMIEGHRVGEPVRSGIILEVREGQGGTSYRVRWDDTGHETVLFPGSDCHIKPLGDE